MKKENIMSIYEKLIKNIPESTKKEICKRALYLQSQKEKSEKELSESVEKELIDLRDLKSKTDNEIYETLNNFIKKNQYFTYCGPLLININPGPNKIKDYLNLQAWIKETEKKKEEDWKPHLYSFMYYVYKKMIDENKDQMVNVIGQIGSGKTFNIIHILEYYCCMVGMNDYQIKTFDMMHKSLQLIHIMGSIFRENNLESTSCGVLLRIGFNKENKICDFDFNAKIFDLSLPFSQNGRSFSILHAFASCSTYELKRNFNLPEETIHLNFFRKFMKYFSKQTKERFKLNDFEIWNKFHNLLQFFEYTKEEVVNILQIFAIIMLVNELGMMHIKKEDKYKITKGKHFSVIAKFLDISEDELDKDFGSFKDEKQIKTTLISLMKYAYYIVFEYVISKTKIKLKEFFSNLQNSNVKKNSFDSHRSNKSGKTENKDDFNKNIKYINILDFPGEVKDQTLGGLITNIANECIQLSAGSSYSSVVEKLINENVHLNLFKPLQAYYSVRSSLGDKGLLYYLSKKLTESNFNQLMEESATKTYFQKCITFPNKNATELNKNIFKMNFNFSHNVITYNYETLYLEANSIVNINKIYNLFSHCKNQIISSTYTKVMFPKMEFVDYVNELILSLFEPTKNIQPFVVYCLHSNNSYKIFFGKKEEISVEDESELPLILTKKLFKNSLVIPVLYWEWFGFHEWYPITKFLEDFENKYIKIKVEYNEKMKKKNINSGNSGKFEEEFRKLDVDDKLNQILYYINLNKNIIVGLNHLIMKNGTLNKIKEIFENALCKNRKNKEKKIKKQLERGKSFTEQCHLNVVHSKKDFENEIKDENSNFNMFRIMNKSTDQSLENKILLTDQQNKIDLKNKRKNVILPSENLFSMVQNLLEVKEKKNIDYSVFDYSPLINEILIIQRCFREFLNRKEVNYRRYINTQILKIQKWGKGLYTRYRFKRLKICLESIKMIQRNFIIKYYRNSCILNKLQQFCRGVLMKLKYIRKARRNQKCLKQDLEYYDSSDEEQLEKIKQKNIRLQKEREINLKKKKMLELMMNKAKERKNYVKNNKQLCDYNYIGSGIKTKQKEDKKDELNLEEFDDKNDKISAILLDENLMRENDKTNREIANQKGISKVMKKELLGFKKNLNENDKKNNKKIEDRLIEYGEITKQRKAESQIEKLKKEDVHNLFKPKISKYNYNKENTIISKSFEERNKYYEDLKKNKLKQIKTSIVDPDEKELTFKPNIGEHKFNKKRSIKDLFKWQQKKNEKLEEEILKKKKKEEEELEQIRAFKYLNDNSIKILEKKYLKDNNNNKHKEYNNNIHSNVKNQKDEENKNEEEYINLWPDNDENDIKYVEDDNLFENNNNIDNNDSYDEEN